MHRILENYHSAQYALEYALLLDPSAMIAGGFVRDRLLNQGPTDVDVFFRRPSTHERTAESFRQYMAARSNMEWISERRGGEEYADDGAVVYKLRPGRPRRGMLPVDLVMYGWTVTPGLIFDNFDIGLCEAALTDRGLTTSTQFEADAADRRLTVKTFADEGPMTRTQEHLERLLRKYPDYEVVWLPVEDEADPLDLGEVPRVAV